MLIEQCFVYLYELDWGGELLGELSGGTFYEAVEGKHMAAKGAKVVHARTAWNGVRTRAGRRLFGDCAVSGVCGKDYVVSRSARGDHGSSLAC